MKVIATGGAGFIGSHMVRRLLDEGCEVLNIDKLTYAGSLDNLGEYVRHKNHQFQQTDICDHNAIYESFLKFKPDAVIHMAAESHVDRSIDSPQIFIQTNIVGTHNLIKAAYDYWQSLGKGNKNKFRFLHLSTDEVFGALDEKGCFTENSPYQPNSPYSASKASSDLLVRSYWKTYKFPALIVNVSNNYGPNQYPEKLIPLTILNALEGRALPVYGKGLQIRDWLHVTDHVEALWQVLTRSEPGDSYCVGGENEIRNIELVEMICDILDKKMPRDGGGSRKLIEFVSERPGHDYRYATDISKIKNKLDWSPKIPFAKGLESTVDWYIEKQNFLKNIHTRERQGKAKNG